jgi:hypothetical protein
LRFSQGRWGNGSGDWLNGGGWRSRGGVELVSGT